MSVIRKTGSAITVACVVLGFGYIVQTDPSSAPREVRKASQPSPTAVRSVMMSTTKAGAPVFGVPQMRPEPLPQLQTNVAIATIDTMFAEMPAPQAQFTPSSPMDDCETDLSVEQSLAGVVGLTISAPCHASSDFVVWHEDLAFSGQTDATGNTQVQVPALTIDATFVVTFDNVEEARTSVAVPEAANYDRVVLQWRGNQNLQLHALEFGATIGDPGHVWSASTQNRELAAQGRRGFMMRLGDGSVEIPYWAEVYTYPAGSLRRDGHVALQVGAAVNQLNCGRTLQAVGLQTQAGAMHVVQGLSIAVPNCDQIGRSVLHPDLFSTMRTVEG